MSADDDDRTIDPAFEAPVDMKERCRRAIAFLQRARDLPELSPAQIDRIERRLHEPPPRPARRPLLSPALAALCVLLLAGGALAMTGRDLTWIPGIGRWLGTRHEQPGAPAPRTGIRMPSAESPRAAPAVAAPPAVTLESGPAPALPTVAIPAAPGAAAPAVDRPAHRAHKARVALAHVHEAPAHRVAAEPPGLLRALSEQPTAPAFAPAPPATPQGTAAAPPSPLATSAAGRTAAATERETPPVAASVPAAAVAASPIVAESRAFASALERWHRDHDAAAALAALDVHERRFPSGQLGLEARLLRVEILLASRRESDALALLDHMGIAGVPRARELRTVRGELRVKLGRCADGKADLKAVLAGGTADPLARRARQAIATCP